MAKEILSMRQAKCIVDSVNDIMAGTVKQIESGSEEFVGKIATIWEDQNAVEAMRIYKQNMEDIINELNTNTNTYANAVKDIADAYAKVGGIAERLALPPIKLTSNINIDRVKENFADGENGDDFGFRNPEQGADQVMDAWEELKSKMMQITSDATSKIGSINAFGNQQVKLNLAESAGRIVSIVKDHLNTTGTQYKQLVDATASKYISLGQSAESASNLSAE